jgi:hypothetical protein
LHEVTKEQDSFGNNGLAGLANSISHYFITPQGKMAADSYA